MPSNQSLSGSENSKKQNYNATMNRNKPNVTGLIRHPPAQARSWLYREILRIALVRRFIRVVVIIHCARVRNIRTVGRGRRGEGGKQEGGGGRGFGDGVVKTKLIHAVDVCMPKYLKKVA